MTTNPLPPDEEARLVAVMLDDARPGPERDDARNRLVLSHSGICRTFAIAAVRRWGDTPFDADDYHQAGLAAGLRWIKGYDPARGTKVNTYLANWFRHGVSRLRYRSALVRIPEYTQTGPKRDAAVMARRTVRIDDSQALRESLADRGPSPLDRLVDAERLRYAEAALGLIDARSREVVSDRMGLRGPKQLLKQIAARMGCTKQYVSRIEQQALETLRGFGDAYEGRDAG